MSKHTRKPQLKDSLSNARTILAKVEVELAERCLEVEIEGLSFTRLVCIYIAGAREARDRMANSISKLLRLHPAHPAQ